MMFVLDANTLACFSRGDGRAAERGLALGPADFARPTVVALALDAGIARSSDPATRRGPDDPLLGVVAVLASGVEEAGGAAALRTRLELEGAPMGPMDAPITGTALAHQGEVLVTLNVREFGWVPRSAVEDGKAWASAEGGEPAPGRRVSERGGALGWA